MKLKELCKYCEWNHQGHCTMGNDNWKALMAEEEVGCEDFEPINLCVSCKKNCREEVPETRIMEKKTFKADNGTQLQIQWRPSRKTFYSSCLEGRRQRQKTWGRRNDKRKNQRR